MSKIDSRRLNWKTLYCSVYHAAVISDVGKAGMCDSHTDQEGAMPFPVFTKDTSHPRSVQSLELFS